MFKKYILLLFSSFLIFGGLFIAPTSSQAAIDKPQLGVTIPGVTFSDAKREEVNGNADIKVTIPWIQDYTNGIYGFLLLVAGIVAMAMITIGGLLYATSGGNQNRIGTAQDMIVSAISGLVLLFLIYTILFIINPRIVDNPGISVIVPKPAGPSDTTIEAQIAKECVLKTGNNALSECATCRNEKVASFCEKKCDFKDKNGTITEECAAERKRCVDAISDSLICNRTIAKCNQDIDPEASETKRAEYVKCVLNADKRNPNGILLCSQDQSRMNTCIGESDGDEGDLFDCSKDFIECVQKEGF